MYTKTIKLKVPKLHQQQQSGQQQRGKGGTGTEAGGWGEWQPNARNHLQQGITATPTGFKLIKRNWPGQPERIEDHKKVPF